MKNKHMEATTVPLSLESSRKGFDKIREVPLEPEITLVSYEYWKWYEENVIRGKYGRKRQ